MFFSLSIFSTLPFPPSYFFPLLSNLSRFPFSTSFLPSLFSPPPSFLPLFLCSPFVLSLFIFLLHINSLFLSRSHSFLPITHFSFLSSPLFPFSHSFYSTFSLFPLSTLCFPLQSLCSIKKEVILCGFILILCETTAHEDKITRP